MQYGFEESIVRLWDGWQVGAEDAGGPHGTYRVDRGAELCRVDLVYPWAVDGYPQQLKVANLVGSRAYIGGCRELS